MKPILMSAGTSLAVVGAGMWVVARAVRKQAQANLRTAELNFKIARENRHDADTVAAMAEANAEASRRLVSLANAKGVSQDEVPRCRCGLLLRKTKPGEAGYPEARVCPMNVKEPGHHDSWYG